MKFLVFTVLVGIVVSYRVNRASQCTGSYDCSSAEPCCRDSNGRLMTKMFPIFGSGQQKGVCSSVMAKENEICEDTCGCHSGYTCYRPMAGIRLPMKCYNSTWVEQQKHYWANCHPPKCYYPP